MSIAIDEAYFHTTKYIINHDIMHCTAEGVVGNHLYSGRSLGFSEPWDIIQLHPDLASLWDDINAHYRRIGLTHTENVIWNLDLNELGSHIGYQPSVFFYGRDEFKYWGDDQWLETVDFINSKNNFMALANKLGIDVPKTLCFDSIHSIDPWVVREIVFPCYIKAAISVSGVGIYRCQNEDELHEAIGKFNHDVPVQVQEEVLSETFLNMQYMVTGNELVRLEASEQILDGFVHQGNRVPSSHAPWDMIEPMALWLKQHGLKGIFALDVAVVETDKGFRYPAIECNPRFNGASYPTMIARKLGIQKWIAINMSTRHRALSDINLDGIEYNPETGSGVIIVNWGTVLAGKIMMLLAGSRAYQDELLLELKARLC